MSEKNTTPSGPAAGPSVNLKLVWSFLIAPDGPTPGMAAGSCAADTPQSMTAKRASALSRRVRGTVSLLARAGETKPPGRPSYRTARPGGDESHSAGRRRRGVSPPVFFSLSPCPAGERAGEGVEGVGDATGTEAA